MTGVLRERATEPTVHAKGSPARHPADGVRLALGVAALCVAAIAVERDRLSDFERDLFRLVNDLPSAFDLPLQLVMQAGNALAGPVAAVVAIVLLRRTPRLAFDLALAGPVAWVAAKGVKRLMERPRPAGLVDDLYRETASSGLGFVSGHTAVAAALATAAAPYLPRRWRRALWAVVWLVGLARVYEGAHLPLDILGGAAVGWAIGATIHILLGAPHRVPDLAQAGAALARAGMTVTELAHIPGEPQGSFPFAATFHGRRVFVKLLDPEPRDRDWLYRIARFVAVRDVREEAALLDARIQAEHEAAMTLMADAAGVRTPAIRRVIVDGERVWLVEDAIDGMSLGRAAAAGIAVTHDRLVDLWREVHRLHGAGIAHRDLVADNVLVDSKGLPWLVDFAHATTSPSPHALDNDVAELLVATAALVGVEGAAAAARAGLGDERVARAATELQPLALTAVGRRTLRHHPGLWADLHAAINPDEPTDVIEPSNRAALPAMVRAGVAAIVLAVVGGASAWTALTTGSWRWAAFALVLAAGFPLHRAAATIAASGRPLALGRAVVALLVADGRAARQDGRRAWDRAMAGHLRRAGLPRWPTEAALGRLARVEGAVAVATVLAATPIAIASGTSLHGSWRVAVAVAVAVGLLLWHAGHSRPAATVAQPFDGRAQAMGLFVAAAALEVATVALVTAAAAKSVGITTGLGAVLAAAALSHVPSLASRVSASAGVADVVLLAGLLLVGVAPADAVAVVVLASALLRWLPAAAGWVLDAPARHRLVL